MPYKPYGYTSVTPYLTVNGAQATIDFLECGCRLRARCGCRSQDGEVACEDGDADRRGGFTDSGGTTWWVTTRMACPPADTWPARKG